MTAIYGQTLDPASLVFSGRADTQYEGLRKCGRSGVKDEEVEAMAEQVDALSEENEVLKHRLCDMEEKNKRLDREIQKMKVLALGFGARGLGRMAV